MTASSRTARAGLFAFAAILVVDVLLQLWSRHLWAQVSELEGGFAHVGKQLELIGYGYIVLGLVTVGALVAVARAPVVSRVGTQAAIAAGLAFVIELAQRVLLGVISSGSAGRLDRILMYFGLAIVLADTVCKVLVVVIAVRVGRAVQARGTTPLALAAFVALVVSSALYVTSWALVHDTTHHALETVSLAAFYLAMALVVSAAITAGVLLSRLPEAAVTAEGRPEEAALSPAWRSAADGIALYLGGAAARVVCAVLGYAAMAGSSSGTGTPDLHAMHDSVFVVAVLSGAASLAMLTGVWRITRAPPESGGTGPAMATLALMIMGLVLDLVTTSITLDALGGSLSAAFFAMDALPLLAGGAALLGVGAGVALLRSFGNMAHALGADELKGRAKSATALLVIAGAVAGFAMLGLKHMPVEVLGLVAVVVLPLAIAMLVQFLRVAVPLGRMIRARLTTT